MKRTLLLGLLAFGTLFTSQAQNVLLVNDNDNITYNTDTLLNDLLAAGLNVTVWSIPDSGGMLPDLAAMTGYDQVIWYASTDGVDLGFWDLGVQADLLDLVLNGNTLWVVGQDLLYALYGGAPASFSSGDFVFSVMGLTSYDVQSFSDDGGLGCPAVYADAGVAGQFADSLTWIFATNWYMDGVSHVPSATPIYAMGPASYALDGAVSMLHHNGLGGQVMTILFDPALIGSFEARVTFLQETFGYMDTSVGIRPNPDATSELRVLGNPTTDRCVLVSATPLQRVQVLDASGRLVRDLGVNGSVNVTLDLEEILPGVYTVRTMDAEQRIGAARVVKH